ncbi:MAG: hypothetical protein ACE5QV_05550 [Fidelibacterota bacterium]
MDKVSIYLSGGLPLYLLAAVIIIIFSFYFYYRVKLRPGSLRYILPILRLLSFLFIIIVLFEPVLSWLKTYRVPAGVVLLIDNSKSMRFSKGGESRYEKVLSLLSGKGWDALKEKGVLYFYKFSTRTERISESFIDSLLFEEDGTDISAALEKVMDDRKNNNINYIFLFSDGVYNSGADPDFTTRDFNIPVYPVVMGDTAEPKDVSIVDISSGEFARVGESIQVDLTLISSGFENQNVYLSIKIDDRVVQKRTVTLKGNNMLQTVRFQFTPEREGPIKYRAEISSLEGELTYENNSKDFIIYVLKSRRKLLIISGTPGPDFSFLKRSLAADSTNEVKALVQKSRSQFYGGVLERGELKEYNCIILINYPTATSGSDYGFIAETVFRERIPILFIGGPDVNWKLIWESAKILPLAPGRQLSAGKEASVYVYPEKRAGFHPIIRFSEVQESTYEMWRELPPVFFNFPPVQPDKNSVIVAEAYSSPGYGGKKAYPAILFRIQEGGKSIAFLVYGLWRWNMMMWGAGKDGEIYDKIFSNSLDLLLSQDIGKRLVVKIDKKLYSSGEMVNFTAMVYDINYNPVRNAELKIDLFKIIDADKMEKEHELTLIDDGSGKYRGSFIPSGPGEYLYKAAARRADLSFGESEGNFSVQKFSVEYMNPEVGLTALMKIAYNTGGKLIFPEELGSFLSGIELKEKVERESKRMLLWNRYYFLLFAIAFLTAEWILRKYNKLL